MKNKYEFKKSLLSLFPVIIVFLILIIIFNTYKYHEYTKNYNQKINSIINILSAEYPSINEEEIIAILNSNNNDKVLINKYGIDIDNDSVILKNNILYRRFIIIDISIYITSVFLILIIFFYYKLKKEKEVNAIIKYLEEINKHNYTLLLDENSEESLSILKNEIYKTTILLKEQNELSHKDKLLLKDSISDISHQLKTPLTSIMIMLENILDNPSMDEETRNYFIKEIKREISNINFLVQSLLKLSKFDTNTINYNLKDEKVISIIDDTIRNLSALCDLKDITFKVNCSNTMTLKCDKKWQEEALSNILKNAIESSSNNSTIEIKCKDNKVYTEISIIDSGKGIDKNDLPHIFERFYKCKNSSKDSIGIGLALAKSIINQNNGQIKVTSTIGVGTRFTIKYYKI